MTYNTLNDLPKGVSDNLPKKAQEIYLSAYNNASEEYKAESDVESTAHRVAWSAVKNKYEKSSAGNWHRKSED